MTALTHAEKLALEQSTMNLTRWANLGMGIAGALAAWASNSQALLVDGLFSFIGYFSAVFAMRISATAHLGPDRKRPFGYGADESLYATFRSLALLVLILFGIVQATVNIATYASGGDIPELRFGPIIYYMVGISLVCFGLFGLHRRAWNRTGRKSALLHLEMEAAMYDGFLTLAAGAGLLSAPFLRETALGFVTPVMDSIVILLLCGLAAMSYVKVFRKGISELAGVTAAPEELRAMRRAIRPAVAEMGGRIVDVAVTRLGRRMETMVYVDPGRPVEAAEIDDLTARMAVLLPPELGTTSIVTVISQKDRASAGKMANATDSSTDTAKGTA